MKKNLIKVAGICLSLFLAVSCTDNDQPNQSGTCTNTDILGLAFPVGFFGDPTTIALFGYLDNSTSTSSLVPIGNVSITDPSAPTYLQMSSANNAVYNPTNSEYKLVIAEERRVVTISNSGIVTHTPIVTGLPAPDITNAPVYLNGNLYYGHVSTASGNVTFSVLDNNFNPVNSVVIPSANRSGNYGWNFTSATDEVNTLYFVVDNNLIFYDTAADTISASMITGAVIPSGSIIGLEFKETNKLLALHEDATVANSKLVELDVSNPSLVIETDVIALSFEVNFEFFSTTYNKCNQKYYLSSKSMVPGITTANTIRIDLSGTPVIVPLSPSAGWIAGLTLKN